MDPHVHRALHMREQLKQIYRARLPHMGWCDDNTRRKQQVWRRSPQNCQLTPISHTTQEPRVCSCGCWDLAPQAWGFWLPGCFGEPFPRHPHRTMPPPPPCR